ncbi:MAG: DUF427 domain-containing protein [Gammaproteobacteria bacterium]|nr:DUF427 domain-containing protein [Gammaproteobacteria bacterium]NNL49587.1 DUF427 domain-containing protein [Woeseiaceae bacterium]
MKAIWNDKVVADSDDTVFVEGNHYFPMTAVRESVLQSSDMTSFCPWKGTASYFDVVVDGDQVQGGAWYYKEPKDAARGLAGRIAFWRGVKVVED